MCVAWQNTPVHRGKRAHFVSLRCTYSFPNSFHLVYQSFPLLPVHLSFVCRHLAFHIRLTLLARYSRIRRTLYPTIHKICTGSHVRFGFNEHSTYQTNFSWLRIRPAQQKNVPISDERTTNKTVGHLSTIASSDKQNNMGLQTHRATTPKCRKPKSTQTHQPRNVFFLFIRHNAPYSQSHSSENRGRKTGKSPLLPAFRPY